MPSESRQTSIALRSDQALGLKALLTLSAAGIVLVLAALCSPRYAEWPASGCRADRRRIHLLFMLQDSDTVILDESLAALDPENMARTLRCLRSRARSLVVVAHP
jgi:ABC-type enterochelin transport system ATPase subunit